MSSESSNVSNWILHKSEERYQNFNSQNMKYVWLNWKITWYSYLAICSLKGGKIQRVYMHPHFHERYFVHQHHHEEAVCMKHMPPYFSLNFSYKFIGGRTFHANGKSIENSHFVIRNFNEAFLKTFAWAFLFINFRFHRSTWVIICPIFWRILFIVTITTSFSLIFSNFSIHLSWNSYHVLQISSFATW